MNKAAIIVYILFMILTACDKDDGKIEYIGEDVFSSEKVLTGDFYIIYGYSFEEGDFLPFPSTGGIQPDIVVIDNTDHNNNIIGAVLSSPDNQEAFHLNGSFDTAESAESFYNSYLEVGDSAFTELAENVTYNQVWTVKTTSDKYAKLLIKDVVIKQDNLAASDYIEIRIAYHYQPDGSKSFKN